MKHTTSYTSNFKMPRKQRQRDNLQIINKSQVPSKIEPIQNIKQEEEQFLPHDIQADLDLNLQKYSTEVKDELRYLLIDMLKYPSINQAIRHSYANRLGYNDLKHIKNKYAGESSYVSSRFRSDHCQDCNLLLQQREIPICSSVWQFPKAGLGTYNLFKNFKLIMAMLFFLGALFCIISLYINITIIAAVAPISGLVIDMSSLPKLISNYLKAGNVSNAQILLLFQLEAALLLIVILVWWFGRLVSECISQKYFRMVDQSSLSASDFSIMLENVPIHYSNQSLQAQLNRYFESLVFLHNIKNTWGQVLHPFTIKKICRAVPFSLNQSQLLDRQLQGLDHDIYEKKKLFAEWVQQMKINSRFTYNKSQREREYLIFQKMIDRRQNKIKEMEKKAQEQYKRANREIKSTIIVTFDYNQTAQIIQNLNPRTWPAIIRFYLSCKKTTEYFNLRDYKSNQQADIIASRAPEPEDIIWGNVAVPLKILICRKLITWAVLILLSGVCLAIVQGLSFAQRGGATIWPSVAIGLIITIFNLLTKFTLRKISSYEKDFTQTQRQRGILLKSLFVMAFNWTIPLTVTNIVNENRNFYGTSGYAQEIFWIAIFEALLPPLVRMFDPQHFFKVILRCWKSRPYQRIILKQSELNHYLQYEQNQLGYSYSYFFNILFLNLFYINLQPAMVIPALIGTFLMYWAQKFCLINRNQRPQKSAKALTDTVQTLISFSPIVLWLGHLVWVNIMISDFSSLAFTLNMILMALSFLYFLTPWKSIYARCCHIPQQEIISFQSCRFKFQTEYDRLNPASLQEGIADYYGYLQDKKKQEDKYATILRSQQNLVDHLNTQYIVQEISKIPSIFGRNNDVSRKIDKIDLIRHKSPKEQDIQLISGPRYLQQNNIKSVHHSNVKIKVSHRQDSAEFSSEDLVNQNLKSNSKGNRYNDNQIFMQTGREQKATMIMSSNGHTFGKKKVFNQKRKTISVLEDQGNYQYQNRSQRL